MSLPPALDDKTAVQRYGCGRTLTYIAIALIFAGLALFLYFGESFKKAMRDAGKGFLVSEVVVSGSEILLELGRTHGDVLEVASPLKTVEIFRKADNRFAAWGWVYLGTTTSEIKVPAHYRFHIKLSELRDARLENGVLFITAPAVYPTLPVAFDTAGMEKKSDDTWLRFDAYQQLAELEQSVTPALAKRAETHVANVRETARRDIEEFVQKWIVDAHPEYREHVRAVKVLFPGEEPAAPRPPKPAPLP